MRADQRIAARELNAAESHRRGVVEHSEDGLQLEGLTHLGWLKNDGRWIVPNRHRTFQGLLLSGPVDGAAWARVADLEQADPTVEARYRHTIQSMMLLDDNKTMIVVYPKKAYWQQMAASYSELDDMAKSLAVQQLAKSEGFLKDDKDLTRIAQMMMVEGLPHHGAKVMKDGLESGSIEPTEKAYNTYSNTLLQSREWELALDPLTKAAELKDDGSLFVRVAQVNLQLGRWGDARGALSRAFDKGGIADEGQAHILFGIAAANEGWST